MALANYNLDLDENGAFMPIVQLKAYFGIYGKSLYRYIESLKKDGFIECTHYGYKSGKNSRRYRINKDRSNEVFKDKDVIKKYNEAYHQYYKQYKHYRLNYGSLDIDIIPNSVTFNFSQNSPKNGSVTTRNLQPIIDFVIEVTKENNKFTPIFSDYGSLRISSEKGKPRFRGRIYNQLCLTKSCKEGKIYLKNDARITRQELLELFGLGDYTEIFDIKSEIPRLTYILQGGNYNDITDFYNIPNISRDYAKKWFMTAYFDGSFKQGAWHITRKWFFDNVPGCKVRDKHKETFNIAYKIVYDFYHSILKPIGTEIFLWSSLWEQLIIKEMRIKYSINLINVYDGFYFNDASYVTEIENTAIKTSEEVRELYNNLEKKE